MLRLIDMCFKIDMYYLLELCVLLLFKMYASTKGMIKFIYALMSDWRHHIDMIITFRCLESFGIAEYAYRSVS